MDLELSDDQHDLRANIRQVLEGACPPALVRSVYEQTGDAADLWRQMTELYWPALGIAEDHGGLGMTFVEVGLLAEELGRSTAPGPLLATVSQFVPLLAEAGAVAADPGVADALLARSAAGEIAGSVAYAEDGRWTPEAVTATAEPTGAGYRLHGTKTSVLSGADADELLVVARAPGSTGADGLGVFCVAATPERVRRRGLFEPSLGLVDLELDGVEVGTDRVVLAPDAGGAERALARAVEEATIAMALHTIGACRHIFDQTLAYAKVREQYDRVIGSFQALKHRLADMYLAVERANALAYYAAVTIAEDDPRRTEAAHLAKVAAGDCQRLLAEDGLQLHGGIGYTWEHDLHFLLKRAKAGELLCGTSAFHRSRLARSLDLLPEEVVA